MFNRFQFFYRSLHVCRVLGATNIILPFTDALDALVSQIILHLYQDNQKYIPARANCVFNIHDEK